MNLRRWLLAASAAVLVAGSLVLPGSPAGAAPSQDLIAWTAQSDANIVDLVVDNSAGLGGVHPLSEIDVPEDTSDFETGPFGYGLATMFWPGAAAGNLGSVSGELGLPSQLTPVAGQLNDPVRAEAFYPGTSPTAVYPPNAPGNVAEMTSHADENGSWAKAGLSDVSVSNVLNVTSVQGSTTATAVSAAESTASGSFLSLSLLGGLIQVGATSSSASATSDGVHPTGTADTHLGAVSVAGVPVSVGSGGLVVGTTSSGAPNMLGSTASKVVNGLVSALNLKMTTLPRTETRQAPTEQITSGGMQISFAIPSSLSLTLDCGLLPAQLDQLGPVCDLPQEVKGLNFTVTIGRVTAMALSAPPLSISLPGGIGPGVPAAGGPTAPGSTPSPLATLAGSSPLSSVGGSQGPTQPGSTQVTGASPGPGASLATFAASTPVQAGLILFLALAVVLASTALRRLRRLLDRPMPDPCPLEDPT